MYLLMTLFDLLFGWMLKNWKVVSVSSQPNLGGKWSPAPCYIPPLFSIGLIGTGTKPCSEQMLGYILKWLFHPSHHMFLWKNTDEMLYQFFQYGRNHWGGYWSIALADGMMDNWSRKSGGHHRKFCQLPVCHVVYDYPLLNRNPGQHKYHFGGETCKYIQKGSLRYFSVYTDNYILSLI